MKTKLTFLTAMLSVSKIFSLFPVFLFVGCVEFSNPILPYSDSFFDENIIGLWNDNTDDETSNDYILILWNSDHKKYELIAFSSLDYLTDTNEFENDKILVYTGEFDNDKYMIFYFSEDDKYFFLKYKTDNDLLFLYMPNSDAIEKAIQENMLSGTVSKEEVLKAISVTAKTNELQTFFKKNKNILFDINSSIKYKKIKEFK